MKKLKLTIELIPLSCWGINLRNLVSISNWNKIRKGSYKKAGYKCKICKSLTPSGKLQSHEIWEFDNKKHIQKLKGFQALCLDCHAIKHIGRAGIVLDKKEMNQLIRHFCKINGVKSGDFKKHQEESWELWRKRSKRKWEIYFGKWKKLLIKNPKDIPVMTFEEIAFLNENKI